MSHCGTSRWKYSRVAIQGGYDELNLVASIKKRLIKWKSITINKEDKEMKSSWQSCILGLTAVVVLLATGLLGCAQAPEAGPITFELVTGVPATEYQIKNDVLAWAEEVTKQSGGRLTIKFIGGPEAVPPMEQLAPLSENVYQLLFSAPAYMADRVPAGIAVDVSEASPAEYRNSGFTRIFDEMYQEKANAKVLSISRCSGYRIYLTKRIDKADLAGLRLRATPTYIPMVTRLGGVTTYMPISEMFPALQQGVIDGLVGPPPVSIISMGVHELIKYIVTPSFGKTTLATYVNLDAWNSLPKDLQDILAKAPPDFADNYWVLAHNKLKEDMVFLKEQGVEEIVLSPAESKKLLDAWYTETWALVLKNDPNWGSRLKEAADKIPR
ncbi:TRAP transporter substrate-binding protein DctP [Chloroflexota bacterium]